MAGLLVQEILLQEEEQHVSTPVQAGSRPNTPQSVQNWESALLALSALGDII